jgi:hypothetical protein
MYSGYRTRSFERIAQPRKLFPDLLWREVFVLLEALRSGQEVEDRQACPNLEEAFATKHRENERERMDQMGGDSPQHRALLRRLLHQHKVSIFQITDTTVHDLRRTTRGAEGEILLFHEPHRPPAEGGVPSGAAAGDASPYDEQI